MKDNYEFTGLILNEYGEKLGYFAKNDRNNDYAIKMYGQVTYGYTEQEVYNKIDKLGCQAW